MNIYSECKWGSKLSPSDTKSNVKIKPPCKGLSTMPRIPHWALRFYQPLVLWHACPINPNPFRYGPLVDKTETAHARIRPSWRCNWSATHKQKQEPLLPLPESYMYFSNFLNTHQSLAKQYVIRTFKNQLHSRTIYIYWSSYTSYQGKGRPDTDLEMQKVAYNNDSFENERK